MSLLPVGFGASGDDYEITDSLRLRSSASAYLTRTFSTPTDNKKWTFSFWFKRGALGTVQTILSSTLSGNEDQIYFPGSADTFRFYIDGGIGDAQTVAVFRDPSAWYHMIVVCDTANATATDRAIIYVNGVRQTVTGTNFPLNAVPDINGARLHYFGRYQSGAYYTDGYLTEVNFIDGQALTPSDFGEYDANGTWKAKRYTGTYGNNGFYLPMKPTTQAELQNTALYAGNTDKQSIDGVGYAPDLVWIKNRTGANNHYLYDTVRGTDRSLLTNATNADNVGAQQLTSFDTDGFTVPYDVSGYNNYAGRNYVAWTWDAGDNQTSTGISSVLYVGQGVAQSVKGFGFSPDLVWIKNLAAASPLLIDSVRGPFLELQTNSTGAETSNNGTRIASIDADGFSFADTAVGGLNQQNNNYVAWGWDAGDGDPVSNTDGDITSTVKANDATGFSIVSVSGQNNTSTLTVGHGLSTTPDMIIGKSRNGTGGWAVWHKDLSSASHTLFLNSTAGEAVDGGSPAAAFSAVSSSTITIQNYNRMFGNGVNGIIYAFSEVSGVSKFGSYEGTGTTTGNVVTTGFRPGFVMVKNIDAGSTDWYIWDSTRDPFLSDGDTLRANLSNAETSGNYIEFTDTGFQLKEVSASYNASGNTYIYMAFKGSYSDHVSPLNTTGTIDSRVKANPSKGFSIVSYEGNNGSNQTVGHGLGVTPSMFIIKNRTSAASWPVYHKDISTPLSNAMYLNSTNAAFGWAYWGTGGLNSTVFPVHYGSADVTNQSGKDYIAYCFSEVAGYSKIDKYTGNGSTTGPVITTGFKPAFVMTKRTDSPGNWYINDGIRSPNNPTVPLYTESANAEGGNGIDLLSNGFQIKNADSSQNASGGTYIYMAFAETADARFNFDASGNKNNWLPNNINSNAESESTYDLMKDTPSLVDENAGNFATLNPLQRANGTLSNGNLSFVSTTLRTSPFIGTISVDVTDTDGYWYEVIPTQGGVTNYYIGFAKDGYEPYNATASTDAGFLGFLSNGHTANEGVYVGTDSSAAWVDGDVVGIGVKNGGIYVSINGVPANSGNPLITGKTGSWKPWLNHVGSSTTTFNGSINFGQQPFAYTPPTGFKKYNTFNLPDSTIEDGSDYFNTVLYSGNSSTQSITGVGFQPDWLWLKSRSNAANHGLFDVLRVIGSAEAILSSNTTAAENTGGAYISSFDSDGFTVNANSSGNASGQTYVGWNWKANGSGVSNTDGTITSTVSANPTAGFSIVSFTAPSGTGNFSAGHGLGVTPAMVIVKTRDSGSAPWYVWQNTFSNLTDDYMRLNATNAKQTQTSGWGAGMTSSVIGLKAGSTTVATENHIAYCFAEVEGYSVFGSYTGNGSTDGPFVYTGFRPAFIITKNASGTGGWHITDTARFAFNSSSQMGYLDADTTAADVTARIYNAFSNGFQIRDNGSVVNSNGSTYIYMAFAENPFKNANAR